MSNFCRYTMGGHEVCMKYQRASEILLLYSFVVHPYETTFHMRLTQSILLKKTCDRGIHLFEACQLSSFKSNSTSSLCTDWLRMYITCLAAITGLWNSNVQLNALHVLLATGGHDAFFFFCFLWSRRRNKKLAEQARLLFLESQSRARTMYIWLPPRHPPLSWRDRLTFNSRKERIPFRLSGHSTPSIVRGHCGSQPCLTLKLINFSPSMVLLTVCWYGWYIFTAVSKEIKVGRLCEYSSLGTPNWCVCIQPYISTICKIGGIQQQGGCIR